MTRNAFTAEDKAWLDGQDAVTLRMELERAEAHAKGFREELKVFGAHGDDLAYLNTICDRGRYIQGLLAALQPARDA